jgi:probable cysteine desulfurase
VIYADNAATTQLDDEAFAVMKKYLREDYGNASQPYSFARTAKKALHEARAAIAECIGAHADEIYFTSGGTESDNWALKGVALGGTAPKQILTSSIEHHAILHCATALEQLGHHITYLPVDKYGIIAPETLEHHMAVSPHLTSIMLANNEIGTVEPIAVLAEIAHKHGSLFHSDAVQAVGHIPVDVNALGIDLLSASGHKFHGPKGVGFLYIRRGTRIVSYASGGAQENGLRAGTENIPAIAAMAKALENACLSMTETQAKLSRMEDRFFEYLQAAHVPYIKNGAIDHLPGCINISIQKADGEMLLHRLDLKGICISTGSACDSKTTQASHVIQAIGVPTDYAHGTIRITFGKTNKEDDAYFVAKAVSEILRKH